MRNVERERITGVDKKGFLRDNKSSYKKRSWIGRKILIESYEKNVRNNIKMIFKIWWEMVYRY